MNAKMIICRSCIRWLRSLYNVFGVVKENFKFYICHKTSQAALFCSIIPLSQKIFFLKLKKPHIVI